MITCRECNKKFRIKLRGYKTKCPNCNDIVDFREKENICLFMDLIFVVFLVVCILIGRSSFFDRLPLLQRVGAYAVMLIIVGGAAQAINKWILRKMYDKMK